MKRYINTLFIGLGVLLASTSCDDEFLNKTDPTVLVSDNFYQTETQLIQAVNGVYGQLRPWHLNQWQYTEFISDNTTLHFNPGNRGNGPSLEALEFWQYNPATSNITNLYNSTYGIMVNVNTSLSKLPESNASDAIKNRSEGELKMIRAYLYFHLVQHFGDVIVITEPVSSPAEAFEYNRTPVEAVYQQILSDLNDAVALLPPSYGSDDIGRVTKGAALSLLGKVHLTRKNYAEAINALTQVTSLGYALLQDYEAIFDPQNKNHQESIWDIHYQGDNQFGVGSNFIYTFAPRESVGAVIDFPGQDGGGWNTPTNEIIALYEEGDLRKEVSLKEGYTSLDGSYIAVPYINKFHHPHSIRGVTNDNWPVIRYADVLLMLAEAINEVEGPTGTALGYLNEIRDRAGLEPVNGLGKDAFREVLLNERRIELAFENHRWFDLKRTKTESELVNLLNAYGLRERANPTTSREGIPFSNNDFIFEAHEILFPIPQDQMRINSSLVQNPGY
ncbi:RagB/SusD family nutrient uptake outer membrane protein [Cyclobacterium marinum]|uniref:RagB/SusD domain-containing protein n=1 Tax=Cyclobacterium marinum (strain ATCC 25205 / DSM 745 / LMG 13164 / NCIMB 1802) TaxID=880070 RepID=G0J116_CYCMS|nr:RagB/SusD family nutrient uptake outer membrane protein [Cyclobacterium marinum]AEL25142.1 RagB/SusD domain-containing protein [Cyclobacterium marinum DSM 745]MBI0401389.1 RagB/SusD family nutrient uptake outer membrane protein [Cyclobacterium marinum]